VVLCFENGEGIVNIPLVHAGLGCQVENMDLWYSTKMLASTESSELPIAMSSVYLYMVLLKLNSTEDVAVFIISI